MCAMYARIIYRIYVMITIRLVKLRLVNSSQLCTAVIYNVFIVVQFRVQFWAC